MCTTSEVIFVTTDRACTGHTDIGFLFLPVFSCKYGCATREQCLATRPLSSFGYTVMFRACSRSTTFVFPDTDVGLRGKPLRLMRLP